MKVSLGIEAAALGFAVLRMAAASKSFAFRTKTVSQLVSIKSVTSVARVVMPASFNSHQLPADRLC